MPNSNDSIINLQDAGLFSDLTYAPTSQTNSFAWATSGQNGANSTDAQEATALSNGGWIDVTQALASSAGVPYGTPTNEFRIYKNSGHNEIVFDFKGTN